MAKTIVRSDAWLNLVTGLGTFARDKLQWTRVGVPVLLSEEELRNLYDGNAIAARIVDAPVDEALRQGFGLKFNDDASDPSELVERAADVVKYCEDTLKLTQRIGEAWTWGRAFGGGAIFLAVEDGAATQTEPLIPEKAQRVVGLSVLDRQDLHPLTYYGDPRSPKFGEPETYMLTPITRRGMTATGDVGMAIVHETRLVIFGGVRTSRRTKEVNRGWDLSVLQRCHDHLRDFGVSFQALAHLLQDASQGVFKMDGLIEMIASNQADALRQRMALADMQRSVAKTLMIDAEKEEFTRLVPALSGYPESIQLMMLLLAATANMPVTVLMGMSPAGLNATGESDRLLWYARCESDQEFHAKPAYTRIVDLVLRSKDVAQIAGTPARWEVTFAPLMPMSDEQRSTIRKQQAEADGIYIDRGVVMAEEVAVSRFAPGGWSAETTIEMSTRRAMLEAMATPPEKDPVDPPDPEEGDDVPEPTPAPAPTPARPGDPDPAPTDPQAVDPQTALNGAQVTALLEIVRAVGTAEIPKTTGAQLIAASFPLSLEEANEILKDIVPEEPPPPPAPGAPGAVPVPGRPSRVGPAPEPTDPPTPPEPEDEPRGDGLYHVHRLPDGTMTSPASGTPHWHALADGQATGGAPDTVSHTHTLPDGTRTGAPIENE